MNFYGGNVGRSLSPRQTQGRSQAPSFQQQRAPRLQLDNNPILHRSQPSPVCLPNGSSFNFFAVISKFEALDALSLQIKGAPDRVMPIQSCIHAPTTRGRTNLGMGNSVSRAFSQKERGRYTGVTTVGYQGSGYTISNDLATDGNDKSYRRQNQTAIKPLPLYTETIPCVNFLNPVEVYGPANRNAKKTQLRSIKDIISFFDGCKGDIFPCTVAAIKNPADLSLPAVDALDSNPILASPVQVPKTPFPSLRMTNNSSFLTNTLGSQQKVTPNRSGKSKELVTPTKHSAFSIQKMQNFESGLATPSAFVQSPLSPPKLLTPPTSSKILLDDSVSKKKRADTRERSPVRSARAIHPPLSSDRISGVSLWSNGVATLGRPIPGLISRSRGNEALRSDDRRDFSGKIEIISQGKGFEKGRSIPKKLENPNTRGKDDSFWTDKPSYQDINRQSHIQNSGKRHEPRSRVARMRTVFEQPSSRVESGTFHEHSSHRKAPAKMRASEAPRTTPTASALPSRSTFRNDSVILPRDVPHSVLITASKDSPLFCSYTSNSYQTRRPNSSIGGDRIKGYDSRNKNGPLESMSYLSLQPKKSLTSIRPPLNNSPSKTTRIPKHFLDGRNIQYMYAELQAAEKATRSKKRKTFIEKWNFRLPGQPASTGTDGTEDLLSSSSTDPDVMVVKEADCRLREPKPLRIMEMKRMVTLCRGRPGALGIEKKERHVQ